MIFILGMNNMNYVYNVAHVVTRYVNRFLVQILIMSTIINYTFNLPGLNISYGILAHIYVTAGGKENN
ncbi:hypothetical protein QTP88_021245 [Uroleucon formosanum]